MKFGVLAGNSHLNSRIYEMFEDIDASDVLQFVKKFKSERNEQRFHTFRELIIGSQFRKQGLNLRYGQRLRGKTPDWVLIDNTQQVCELLDVVSLHQRREVEADMMSSVSAGQVWSGWITIPPDHIYSKIEQKANAYAALAAGLKKPYVVCLFGEFTASVDPDEVEHVLYHHHGGAFSRLPTLSGVVYFVESSGSYHYSYYPNHNASHASLLMSRQE
jgi:hypothetical protein